MATVDDEERGYAWETPYERTWETLHEDEGGLLEGSVLELVNKAKRKRLLERKANVRLGIMRHVFVIVDMSDCMLDKDLLPTRQNCVFKHMLTFMNEFFDQNPIGQLGFIIARNKRAEKISELSGNARKHLDALKRAADEQTAFGEMSLQNSLELALQQLKHMPAHTSREVLVVMGSLSTCDPGNVLHTVELLKRHKIKCSVIGLSAEVFVCKQLCEETGGKYNVILDETHFKDLLSSFTLPPLCSESQAESNLVRMGFPGHKVTTGQNLSMCMCHLDAIAQRSAPKGFTESGYFCPQCQSKYCELPVECRVCGLTLISAPHLARSYHHLFPIHPFREVEVQKGAAAKPDCCFACRSQLEQKAYVCERCEMRFCIDCDLFVHETLNTCPGCTAKAS